MPTKEEKKVEGKKKEKRRGGGRKKLMSKKWGKSGVTELLRLSSLSCFEFEHF